MPTTYSQLEKNYNQVRAECERLRKLVVMKFSEERVPQFSQGFESHELLEPVTADDCVFYVGRIEELTNRIEELTDRIAELSKL